MNVRTKITELQRPTTVDLILIFKPVNLNKLHLVYYWYNSYCIFINFRQIGVVVITLASRL